MQVVAVDWDTEYLQAERRLAAWDGWDAGGTLTCPDVPLSARLCGYLATPETLTGGSRPSSAPTGKERVEAAAHAAANSSSPLGVRAGVLSMNFSLPCHALRLSFQSSGHTLMTLMLIFFLITSARHRYAGRIHSTVTLSRDFICVLVDCDRYRRRALVVFRMGHGL